MKERKCYISLPITGRDLDEVGERIVELARNLTNNGYIPISPFDREVDFNASYETQIREDFRLLLNCNYILMAYGWERSVGCRIELNAALACGIKVMFEYAKVL